MIHKKYMPLIAGAVMLFAASPVMAGTFITDICLSLQSTVFPTDTVKARLGATDMGSNHFQLNGVGQFISTATNPPLTSRTTAVSGSAEIRANGDVIISANSQVPVDELLPGETESDHFSILLPAGGGGTFSDNIVGFNANIPFPRLQDQDHGTAAIVSCTGFGL